MRPLDWLAYLPVPPCRPPPQSDPEIRCLKSPSSSVLPNPPGPKPQSLSSARVSVNSMAGAGIHPFHQQWPPAAAAPPPPGAAASVAVPPPPPVPGAPGTVAAEEVRTIFITGLPADVKERELHNLLRWLPGFEASQINFKGDQPMGFALFSTAHQAVAAKAALQVCFGS